MNPGHCAAGNHPATIAVSDGALSAQQSFTIVVADVARAPAWASAAYSLVLAEGAAAALDVATSDPDQACGAAPAALVLAGTNAGSGLSLSFTDNGDGTGRLAVTAGPASQGAYAATLRATDSAAPSLVADATVSITVTHSNLAPVAEAGGPYQGLAGIPVEMTGSGSTDPDGDALTYGWSFGDGATGTGADVAHTYAADGAYTAVLAVRDGVLADSDSATVTIEPAGRPLEARAWCEPRTIRLQRGRATERVYLEPIGASFDLAAVVTSSITLSTSSGAGRVATVSPAAGKPGVRRDHDRNGVPDLRLEFRDEDLAALCSFVERRMPVTFTLTATLLTGGEVRASFTADLVPEKKKAFRHVGPNPLNPEAIVTLDVSQAGPVRLRVYDLGGRLVRTLYEGEAGAGQTLQIRFDGRDGAGRPLSSGRYYLRAELAGGVESSTVTILK
jgi:hypothetical protein